MHLTQARTSWILLAALAVLTTLGCRHEAKVGVVLPLTGKSRVYGEASRNGIELALEDLQAAGVTRYQLRIVDSGSDPARAGELLRQLYADDAVAAIGGLTPAEIRELGPAAEASERILLAPSAALGDETAGGRHVYSIATSDFTAGTTMATFAARELDLKSAVVIGEPEAADRGLEEGFRTTFENQGRKVLASITTGDDAAATVGEALGHEPDAVFLAGYEPTVGVLVRELKERGYPGRVLTTQALASAASLRQLGEAAQGVLMTHTKLDPEASETVGAFAARYRAKYGQAPGTYAAEGYDALMVLAEALGDRPALASEVRKGLLHEVKDYPGVTGEIQFNEARGVTRIPRVYSVAEDLSLHDHGKWLRAERERIEEEKKKLMARLKEIRGAATQASSS